MNYKPPMDGTYGNSSESGAKNSNLKRIGVLTSGGDSPGMNAGLRAIVRTAIYHGAEVVGIFNGYEGLIQGKVAPLSLKSVGNIIQRGGTFLGTSRSEEFRTKQGRKKAYHLLQNWGVGSLIAMGGDGTMHGAGIFSNEYPVNVIGIPCTIDNDIVGTDLTIGFDTAVNTAVEAIDKIRDTADSHARVFVIEVMGRNTGHIALETALAVGAEVVTIPETPTNNAQIIKRVQSGIERGKTGNIIIVAEKHEPGYAISLAKEMMKKIKRDVRAAILGHLQRGGSPSPTDRNLASQLGSRAAELALRGVNRVMVGIQNGQVVEVPFATVVGNRQKADLRKLTLIEKLSI